MDSLSLDCKCVISFDFRPSKAVLVLSQSSMRSMLVMECIGGHVDFLAETPAIDSRPTLSHDTAKKELELSSNQFHKTRKDFMEAMIIRFSGKSVSGDLPPTKRREAIDDILNDPQVKHRFVMFKWPRPDPIPNYKKVDLKSLNPRPYEIISPKSSLPGKMAPNGVQLWGSTLLDFFKVQRIPGLPSLSTTSSGSKLLAWCKANGEYGDKAPAKDCIAWAEKEKDPEIVPVYKVAKMIKDIESLAYSSDNSAQIEASENEENGGDNQDGPRSMFHPVSKQFNKFNSINHLILRSKPSKSLFDRDVYPKPWKGVLPFSQIGPWTFDALPMLEEYIPQSLLPKKLVVHDPWNRLPARHTYDSPTNPWDEKLEDNQKRIYTYKLQLSRERRDDDELAPKAEEEKRILDEFLTNPHSSNPRRPPGIEVLQSEPSGTGAAKPAIYVVLPPVPSRASANEAHLYISGDHAIGEGNHSFVYFAEWEVPRSFLVQEEMCMECVKEDMRSILRDQDGENGENKDRKWDTLSGKTVWKEKEVTPSLLQLDSVEGNYIIDGGVTSGSLAYDGPYRVIHSRVDYQNLERAPYCEHLRKHSRSMHPLTTKVRLAAKLSIRGDGHLEREAVNYQKFPKHFFEHWSGYNILPPLHDPVPVGPLVPQFYGYYVPDEETVSRKDYLSPILLVEHCGEPVKPDSLSVDDK